MDIGSVALLMLEYFFLQLPQTNPSFNNMCFKIQNAYMLVYTREADKDNIVCNVDGTYNFPYAPFVCISYLQTLRRLAMFSIHLNNFIYYQIPSSIKYGFIYDPRSSQARWLGLTRLVPFNNNKNKERWLIG
jgi:hypothetical protein